MTTTWTGSGICWPSLSSPTERALAALSGLLKTGAWPGPCWDETPEAGLIKVVIGQENRGDMLWPLSVVIGQYGIPGEAAGAVGAVGPVRMEYTKTIAGVGLMADVMSKLVESVRDR